MSLELQERTAELEALLGNRNMCLITDIANYMIVNKDKASSMSLVQDHRKAENKLEYTVKFNSVQPKTFEIMADRTELKTERSIYAIVAAYLIICLPENTPSIIKDIITKDSIEIKEMFPYIAKYVDSAITLVYKHYSKTSDISTSELDRRVEETLNKAGYFANELNILTGVRNYCKVANLKKVSKYKGKNDSLTLSKCIAIAGHMFYSKALPKHIK